MKKLIVNKQIYQALAASLLVVFGLMSSYLLAEPTIGRAQATARDQFTISQTVTAEISFLTTASDVTMSPSLPGITGGTANGSTQVRVLTNEPAGYSMTIKASSSPALQGDTTTSEFKNYTPTGGVPDFTFSVGSNTAEFGYTVEASTTTDVDPTFRDNGSTTCGTGSSNTANACWFPLTTSDETIINRSTVTAASGATTTIKFRAQITANPSPIMQADTYTATTTLTAVTN